MLSCRRRAIYCNVFFLLEIGEGGGSEIANYIVITLCSELPEPYQTYQSLIGHLEIDIAVSFALEEFSLF